MDSDSESKLLSLISQLLLGLVSKNSVSDFELDPESKFMSMVIQITSFVRSMDLDTLPKPESKLMSLVSQTVALINSTDLDSLPKPLSKLTSLISQKVSMDTDQKPEFDLNFWSLLDETLKIKPYPEIISLIFVILSVVLSTNTELKDISLFAQLEGYFYEGKFHVTHDFSRDMEPKLISLIFQLLHLCDDSTDPEWERRIMSLIIQIIALFKSTNLDSQPKPESKLMSLVSQMVSLINSTDLDSLPKPLSNLISLISQKVSIDSDQKPESELKFKSVIDETLELNPDHEIISLIRQIVSLVPISMSPELKTIMFLCPQVKGDFDAGGKFCVGGELQGSNQLWECFLGKFDKFRFKGEDLSYSGFHCRSCNGQYHKEYERVPVEIKHPLHQKHYLQLALNTNIQWGSSRETRECYCCDEDLVKVFYFCSACDFAMNIACVEKPRVLSIPLSKWHDDHPLALFPIKTSLTCDICALAHSNSPYYICPPCAFVAHLQCINLPHVLRISRHLHRLCHTPSFEEGNWSCGVCRRKIENDYGGYSCIKDDCSYVAHSRCATQRNVWDGIDLDGEPEEIEEEVVEPFVTISDGIIQHFSHDHHHLRLDESTCRDYDENKLCQACVTPIYFGNFYSCVQCKFVLHETCAHLSRKIYHPIHPHLLTLVMDHTKWGYYRTSKWKSPHTFTKIEFLSPMEDRAHRCSACHRVFTAGFFYKCGNEECDFWLHVQCATVSEPLVHRSHVHPLFLTSKPGEKKKCSVCQRGGGPYDTNETFNCIDECDDFALCFRCATLPQKLRYRHDKHILSLSYGEETDTVTYWCEACEGKINLEKGIYMCDEYCCVTLHVECLIGMDLYMKPGSSFLDVAMYGNVEEVGVQSNNHHMSRPICTGCEERSQQKVVFQCSGSIFCSLDCLHISFRENCIQSDFQSDFLDFLNPLFAI